MELEAVLRILVCQQARFHCNTLLSPISPYMSTYIFFFELVNFEEVSSFLPSGYNSYIKSLNNRDHKVQAQDCFQLEKVDKVYMNHNFFQLQLIK